MIAKTTSLNRLTKHSAATGYWLAIVALVLVTGTFSQGQYNVLDWKSAYSLNSYLIERVHIQYAERRSLFQAALTSKSAAVSYVQDCRNRFRHLIGPFGSKSPLKPVVTGTLHGVGYSIDKVVYESFPGHHVTANLYIPEGKGSYPAAVLFCGHEDAAKATESYQKTAVLLVRNGFVVLVIDPISQGERRQLTDAEGVPVVRGGTTEHTLLNAASNLIGTSTVAYELWDNVRGLDYLETRPEVDTSRIGCLGNSGGGMQTVYFTAFDPRVKVAAVCSFLATRERNFDLNIVSDGCSQMPNEGSQHFEMSDFLIAAAPTPILVLAGRYDFIDYTGTVEAYADLKSIYGTMGAAEKVAMFTYDDGHGISGPKREAAVTWFRRWLYDDSSQIHETSATTFSERELQCTSTGQVNSQYAAEMTVEKKNLAICDSLEPQRNSFLRKDRQDILRDVVNSLAIRKWDHPISTERVGELNTRSTKWQKIIIRKSGEVPLPILESFPNVTPKKVIVWFPGQGKSAIADSGLLIEDYLRQRAVVIVCDLRGLGETSDRREFNDPKYFNKEYRNALLALHMGEPLVGQRVRDVLTVQDFISADPQLADLAIEMNASGPATVPALYALLFDNTVVQLNLFNCPRSFKSILEEPTKKDWYSYVIPGVLRLYDIPDLVEMVGRQRVKFLD